MVSETHAGFQTTSWTLIEAVSTADHPRRRQALERLAERYWPAIYAHLRKSGVEREAAAELTQAFFADVVLGRDLFERAAAHRGKLRTLLLTALRHYRVDQHRRRAVRPDGAAIPLERFLAEEQFLSENGCPDATTAFERRWAVALLEEALHRCERYFLELGKSSHWRLFDAFVIAPALRAAEPPPLADLAEQHGFASAVHAASAVKVARKRMRLALREVCADTAADPEEQEAEYQRVVRLLS